MTADMLLGLHESLKGVVGLLAVFWHHSFLYNLALLLNPLVPCCIHLLSDFSVHFFCTLDFSVNFFCTLDLLQCLCTSVVRAVISGHTEPEPHLWPKAGFFFFVSKGLLKLLWVALLLDCPKGIYIAVKDAEGYKLSTYLGLEHFCYLGFLSFSRSNGMQGLFVKHLVFSFSLMVKTM